MVFDVISSKLAHQHLKILVEITVYFCIAWIWMLVVISVSLNTVNLDKIWIWFCSYCKGMLCNSWRQDVERQAKSLGSLKPCSEFSAFQSLKLIILSLRLLGCLLCVFWITVFHIWVVIGLQEFIKLKIQSFTEGHKTELKLVELRSNNLHDCCAHKTFKKCSGQLCPERISWKNGVEDINKMKLRDVLCLHCFNSRKAGQAVRCMKQHLFLNLRQ